MLYTKKQFIQNKEDIGFRLFEDLKTNGITVYNENKITNEEMIDRKKELH